MNIDFMRFIDKTLGIPICLIFSCIHCIRTILRPSNPVLTSKKIVFIQLSEMGSIILAYSLFKKTKKLFPTAELYFLTFKTNRCAIDLLKIIPSKNVITIDNTSFLRFIFSSIKILFELRHNRIDTAINLELFARCTAILSYLSGAKKRVGFYQYHQEGLYTGNLQTHKVLYNPHIHIAYNLLNLIYAITAANKQIPYTKIQINSRDLCVPKLKITKDAKETILSKLQEANIDISNADKIILLNPNASEMIPIRRWPIDRYILLTNKLLTRRNTFLVITGTKSEKKDADIICGAVNSKRCINFAGQTSFEELIALYSISDILITNDSGPAHFSSLTDIHTFIFFGPETPKLYGPLGKNSKVFYSNYACSPCVSAFNHRKSPCRNNKCLQAISVEEVYDEIKKKL